MRTLACLVAVLGVVLAGCGPSDENEGGCKDKLLAGDLVITEVFADYAAPTGGTGADEGKEWFEIYNASDRPIELEGVKIVHSRPDGASAKSHILGIVTIAPGQYLTLGNSAQDLLPAYVDYGYSNTLGELFNTNGGKLELTCNTTLVDSAEYGTVKSGRSRQLTAAQPPDYTLNDDLAMWCEAADTEFETNNFGTPGADNDCAPSIAGMCSDGSGMRATVAPEVGALVITEFLANPEGTGNDNTLEWFEIKNASATAFDLNGLTVKGNSTMNTVDSPECKSVAPDGYALFAHGTDPATNGGLPTVDATFTTALANSNGTIQILNGDTLVDAITWTTGLSEGASRQLDPDLADSASNDVPSNFCNGIAAYGTNGDLGTPRAANTQCATIPSAGMCDIGNGTLRAVVKPAANALQITEFLANPGAAETGSDATREWVEILNTSATSFDLNGLTIANPNNATSKTTINSTLCLPIAANAFGLLARSSDPALNGMLPTPDATFNFSLVDTNGKIEIRDGDTVLETLVWTSVFTPSTANPMGVSRGLDPDETTSYATNGDAGVGGTANPSQQPWCGGTATYGDATNKGTPKAANPQCP